MKDFFNKIKDFLKKIWDNLGEYDGLDVNELKELNSIAKPVPITSSVEIGRNGVQKVKTILPVRNTNT